MDSETWLEKAERLRSSLARLRQTEGVADTIQNLPAVERVAIAHWLREEFAGDPPEDTQTLPLFSTSPHG